MMFIRIVHKIILAIILVFLVVGISLAFDFGNMDRWYWGLPVFMVNTDDVNLGNMDRWYLGLPSTILEGLTAGAPPPAEEERPHIFRW